MLFSSFGDKKLLEMLELAEKMGEISPVRARECDLDLFMLFYLFHQANLNLNLFNLIYYNIWFYDDKR